MTPRDLLPLYALDLLDEDEAGVVERALAGDPALVAELAALRDRAAALVAPVAPPDHVARRLASTIGDGRFERFAARLAAIYDVDLERARALLGLVDRPASWEQPLPQVPGVGLVHFDGGPACAGADCGFVRLQPGTAFPPHDHVGEETSFILAGHLRDGERVYGPGDEVVLPARSGTHLIACVGDTEVLFAARVFSGIEIGGVPVPARKP